MTGQRGQAFTEYVLVLAFAMVFVFAPVPAEAMRHPDTGQYMSLFSLFIHAFDIYINSFHTVLTLPVP